MKTHFPLFFNLFATVGVGVVLSLAVHACGDGAITTYEPCEVDVHCWRKIDVDNGYRCFKGGCYPPCKTAADCNLPTEDICLDGHCTPPYAVPDAGGDAGMDASSAIGCGSTCTPFPDGWSSAQAVWHGAIDKAPNALDFPVELGGSYAYPLPIIAGYADITAGPATCDVCKCGVATGKCTELPGSIQIRASICGEAGSSIAYGGPVDWDGSCTSANPMPADMKCPAGSSTLCAQSVAVSALGPPNEESCTPMAEALPVAYIGHSGPRWNTTAIGYRVPACEDRGSCLPKIEGLPGGYRSCIFRRGEHECPASWSGERFVVYETTAKKPGWLEGRDCTPCECGAPIGSLCTAQFRVFETPSCTKLISDNPIASLGEQCSNVLPPGKAIGSKEISGLTYIPGICEPTGGEPIGSVTPDPAQAVTFCCLMTDA